MQIEQNASFPLSIKHFVRQYNFSATMYFFNSWQGSKHGWKEEGP